MKNLPYDPLDVVHLDVTSFPALIHEVEVMQDENSVAVQTVAYEIGEVETSLAAEAGDKESHPTLTNETKRKAWIADQLADRGDYQDLLLERAELDAERRRLSRYHTLVVNAFRVARLAYERETARLTAGLV